MSEEMPKLYTAEEARALVPRLRVILTALRAEKRQIEAEALALGQLTPAIRGNGHGAAATRHEARMAELMKSMQDRLDELSELDIQVKDIDTGLVDFLSLREGRVVYLCWQMDEPTVAFWHELDAGYAGRQPLDE